MAGVEVYSLPQVARLFKLSPARLRYWRRTRLVRPERSNGHADAFGFRDLVGIRSLVSLLEQGVPLRRIRDSVEAVRHRIPEMAEPLGALRVWADGSVRVVVRLGDNLFEPDGQRVLDFVAAPGGTAVAPLRGRNPERVLPDPERALVWFERGCSLDGDPRTYAGALEAYAHAIEADPEMADAHCNLGALHYNQGQREQARSAYRKALAIDPGHFEANLNLAHLLEEEERNEAALRHYKAALRADPLNGDVRLHLALLYEKLALPRLARAHWRRYVQLDPRGSWVGIARQRLLE